TSGFTMMPLSLSFSGLIPGVLLVYPDSLNIPRGENVTLLCTNIMKNEGFVAWFQQVNQSVPLCILSTYYTTSGDVLDYKYYNGATAERTKMTVTKNNISLRITAVDLYDMGLYFCGMWVEASLFFANATFLHIRGGFQNKFFRYPHLVNYAALDFTRHKMKAMGRQKDLDTHEVYSATR
uniref:Ig-like domain-containing protein n=1 Tax=Paramormyrops kingsleyae TaxID=1676925 RepID=A0A3B3QST8_9TELE